ncbi:hypothetical protein ACFLRI_04855 [Bacteroidota bacterium]
MNKEQADQILDIAAQHRLDCRIHKKEEEFYLILNEAQHYSSFEASKFAVSAMVAENHYKDSRTEITNFNPFPDPEKDEVPAPENTEKRLKIGNKEELFSYPTLLVFTSAGNVCKVQNNNYQDIPRVLMHCDLDPDEQPIYITGTKYYKGYLIVAFDNGKVGKISMDGFKTEFNRKKLKNAFNLDAPLVFIEYFAGDTDLVAVSNIDKIVVFNTNQINAVGSRTTKGVQVMKPKDRSLMVRVKKLSQVNFADPDYYRKGLNVVGFYLKEGDSLK